MSTCNKNTVGFAAIAQSLTEGVYATDVERRILYWSPAAERITGWRAEDILGRTCYDNVLCHEDKDGRYLCGKDTCPLHRAIITGNSSEAPLLVFGRHADGRMIPLQVSVSPLRNNSGEIIGGVEVFRDYTTAYTDLARARKIQAFISRRHLTPDPRLSVTVREMPVDVVGGDFVAIERVGADHYAFMIADMMGHGVSAALHGMCLRVIWEEARSHFSQPERFIDAVKRATAPLLENPFSFCTCIYGWLDVSTGHLRYVGAGHPPPILMRADGTVEFLDGSGLPLGVESDEPYEVRTARLNPGDSLFAYTDGAIEVADASGASLGEAGLAEMLQRVGFPSRTDRHQLLDEELLAYSTTIRNRDDVTFMEIAIHSL